MFVTCGSELVVSISVGSNESHQGEFGLAAALGLFPPLLAMSSTLTCVLGWFRHSHDRSSRTLTIDLSEDRHVRRIPNVSPFSVRALIVTCSSMFRLRPSEHCLCPREAYRWWFRSYSTPAHSGSVWARGILVGAFRTHI